MQRSLSPAAVDSKVKMKKLDIYQQIGGALILSHLKSEEHNETILTSV